MTKWLVALCGFCFLTAPALARTPCASIEFEKAAYTVCTAKPGQDDIRLFLNGRDGKPYGTFSQIRQELAPGKVLLFAMNAGMYNDKLAPVGLYIENSRQLARLNLKNGPGNFHMRPNGVFYVAGTNAGVMEADRFGKSGINPEYATQSGPMLVIDGKIHPKITAKGTSAKFRNGVGIARDGSVLFAISDEPVTFHAFALLFRDRLDCPNALFLDGSISTLYAPQNARTADPLIPLGPMVGVVADRKKSR